MVKVKKSWPTIRQRPSKGDWVIDLGVIEGKRKTFVRQTEAEAETKAAEVRAQYKRIGIQSLSMSNQQMMEASEAIMLLNGRESILNVVREWVRTHTGPQMSVADVYGRLIESQRARLSRDELRPSSMAATKNRLGPFVADLGRRPIDAITKDEIEAWVAAQDFQSPVSRNQTMRYIKLMLNYAEHNEWATNTPAGKLKIPKTKYRRPEFFTVEDVQKLLGAFEKDKYGPVMLPKLAIGFFAGIRHEELDRMDWSDIHWNTSEITVREEVSKIGIPRQVRMEPCLARWLIRFRKNNGPVGVKMKQFCKHMHRVCKAAGVKWTRNVMRHSYATYHLARYQSPSQTADQLGHISGGWQMLYRHYRGFGITQEDSVRYFEIIPSCVDETSKVDAVAAG